MMHFAQVLLSPYYYHLPISLLIDAWSSANELWNELCSPIPGQLEKVTKWKAV